MADIPLDPMAHALSAPLVNFFQCNGYTDTNLLRIAAAEGAWALGSDFSTMHWRTAMVMSVADAHALADLINERFPREQREAE